jgi:selenocysteine lyase/cysteine desulfurase
LRGGAAGASWLLAGAAGAAEEPVGPVGPASSWETVRGEFDFDRSVIQMAGLLLVSHPRPVREAIARYRQALDHNPPWALREFGGREEAVRVAAANYLAADAGEIALTDSTTMGLGLLYAGVRIRGDQEILSTTHDHASTNAALNYKTAATGCGLRRIALFEQSAEADEAQIVSRIQAEIRETTRVLAVTFVHSSTGVKLPLAAIGKLVAAANVGRSIENRLLFCVDGVHGFGVENITAAGMGCDFFVAGCHKWLFGPRGTGIVWGRKEAWSQVAPIIPTFSGNASPGQAMTPGGFHSFEHRWALADAFEFHQALGKARVEARIHALSSLLKDGLAQIKGLSLKTPRSPERSAGIVCFEIAGVANGDIVKRLAEKRIVASTTPYTVSYARLTPGLLNDEKQIEAVLAALHEIAAG